ncbi:MAG: CDP-alcohol phosphatidyltransferase family protein [Burkholderiales bacterium]|nr:CDP-alcohol phosphatidyltransferase family protein [Burkholderiales bacterium]
MTEGDQNSRQPARGATSDRRPIAARSTGWARAFAGRLVRSRISPNQISVASIGFAAIGAGAMLTNHPAGLIAAALMIQARLLCNLFDGMVAVEGGRQSSLGVLYNEFPDRIADSLLLVAAGYACGMPGWGWSAALFAALTAYVRAFGASLGNGHDFRGPMAKQHRMAVLTAGCVLQALLPVRGGILGIALIVISIGAAITCGTRTHALVRVLRQRTAP